MASHVGLQQLADYQYKHAIDAPTMFVHQHGVTPRHRAHMVDLLIYVQVRYKLEPSVLFLAVNTIDRYIAACMVNIDELALVALSAIGLATRFTQDDILDYYCAVCKSERYVLAKQKGSPNTRCYGCYATLHKSTTIGKYKHWSVTNMYDRMQIDSNEEYTCKKLVSMEKTIAGALDFDLGAVTVYEIAMEGLQYTPTLKVRVTKLLKLGLLSTKMLHHKPLDIARAAIHIVARDNESSVLDATRLAVADLEQAVISTARYTYASKYA